HPPRRDAQHAAARLLRLPLRLRDGRKRDAVREPQRRGLRPPPLRGDRGPHEPLPGARAGDRRARNRLPPRPHGELRARARDGHGGEPARRRHRAPRAPPGALAARSRFAYEPALIMRGLVVRWLVSATALYLTSLIVPRIQLQGVAPLVFAAVTIG